MALSQLDETKRVYQFLLRTKGRRQDTTSKFKKGTDLIGGKKENQSFQDKCKVLGILQCKTNE